MKENEIENLKAALKDVRITLDTIGYESLFMIKGLEVGDGNSSEMRDCLIRINNLSQKAHKKVEKQESTIHYFFSNAK